MDVQGIAVVAAGWISGAVAATYARTHQVSPSYVAPWIATMSPSVYMSAGAAVAAAYLGRSLLPPGPMYTFGLAAAGSGAGLYFAEM